MKKKILVSTLIILVVVAVSLGATMAWFTDQSDPIENVFTAGTVSINANEQWQYGDAGLINWNPGDCTPKFVSVKYEGSKRAFLRMQIVETWDGLKGQSPSLTTYNHDFANIKWLAYVGGAAPETLFNNAGWILPSPHTTFKQWAASSDWEEFNITDDWMDGGDGWWYYKGGTGDITTTINGEDINSIQPPVPNATPAITGDPIAVNPLYLVGAVCLDGPLTDNDYQGATYTMNFIFQAIQATHEGGADGWNWNQFESYN